MKHSYRDLSSCSLLRGNLHAHTTRSDGGHSPQGLIDDYARLGYDFLAITDHDMHLPPEEAAKLDHRGMVVLSGNEVTADGPHMCHLFARHTVSPQWLRQQSIDQAAEDSQSMVVLNHPNWWQNFDHWPTNLLMQMRRYHGVEIFNGVMMGEVGSAYALEKWDMLLGSGQRVWAFANDDTHHATGVGRGWNMVWARERSAQGVQEALISGRFYASTGVKITTIIATDKCIRVETDNARRIIARRDLGQRFMHVDGPVMELESGQWGDANYVRFEAWGEPEQFAWTQPFWLRG